MSLLTIRSSRTRSIRRRRAFTLVEVITTIVVMSLIAAATSRILFQSFSALNDANNRGDLQRQLSAAMERITTELRTVNVLSGSSPATPDITSMTASSITFNAGTSSRTINLSGTTLQMTGAASSNCTLATNVSTFTITGYDASNAALPASPTAGQIATLRRFQITITGTLNGITETLRTKVFVRSMAAGSGAT